MSSNLDEQWDYTIEQYLLVEDWLCLLLLFSGVCTPGLPPFMVGAAATTIMVMKGRQLT